MNHNSSGTLSNEHPLEISIVMPCLNEAETLGSTGTLSNEHPPEVSIVMPCLNEAETLGTCVEKAQRALRQHGIDGEIIVADNGSTDGSQALARALGARVIAVEAKGYGNALMG